MDTRNIVKDSDPIRHDDLRSLAQQPGPAVSFVIPTHRGGAETLSDSQRLRPLLDTAREQLAEHYADADADALLAPVESLADSRRFWQEQCDGLAIFAQPGHARYFRLDRDFSPQVTVGDHPNLRPVLPLVTSDLEFLLLALSRDKVRLFAADRATITELPLWVRSPPPPTTWKACPPGNPSSSTRAASWPEPTATARATTTCSTVSCRP